MQGLYAEESDEIMDAFSWHWRDEYAKLSNQERPATNLPPLARHKHKMLLKATGATAKAGPKFLEPVAKRLAKTPITPASRLTKTPITPAPSIIDLEDL